MKRILLLFLPLLIISLSGCKATKRAYEKGDYETAVVNSIERLRRAPDNKKARQTLKLAYPTMVTHFLEQINIAKVGGSQYKWEEIMGYYDILNRAYNEVKTAPAALEVIPNPQNFIGDYEIARTKAAEVRYVLAGQRLDYARDGDRLAAKEAHEHLLKVLLFRPGYKDAEELSLEALDLATVYVQIEHIPMHSRTLALSNEFFENQLAEEFVRGQISPYIRFYFPGETGRTPRNPDQIIRMTFDDFVVGQTYVKEKVVQRKRDSVVLETIKVNDSTTSYRYGTVTAEVTQFYKQITSTGLLDMRIIDARTGAVISQRKFPGTFDWFDYWGFFNGDKRALTEEDQKFIQKKRESPNPAPQDLFIEFTKPIYGQATAFVREFYRSY